MNYILDTNIVVSAALFPNSDISKAFRHIINSHEPLVSDDTLQEIVEVFKKPKLHKYSSPQKLAEFYLRYKQVSRNIAIISRVKLCT